MPIDATIFEQPQGQRLYGPPSDWAGPPPGRGSEIYICKLPHNCFGEELLPMLSTCGSVYQLRLMMTFSGSNRGYCFVTFASNEQAIDAVNVLNGAAIRPGYSIVARLSVDNSSLSVRNIPESVSSGEVLVRFQQVVEDVVSVEFPVSWERGCAIVEFATHHAACMARRRFIPGPTIMWGRRLEIDWAILKNNRRNNDYRNVVERENVTLAFPPPWRTNQHACTEEMHLNLICQEFGWGKPEYKPSSEKIGDKTFYLGEIMCPGVSLPLFKKPVHLGPFNANEPCEFPSLARKRVMRKTLCYIINLFHQQFPECFDKRGDTSSSSPNTSNDDLSGEFLDMETIPHNEETLSPESEQATTQSQSPLLYDYLWG